jgi:hypothetical protein
VRRDLLIVHGAWDPQTGIGPPLGRADSVRAVLESALGTTEWELGQGLFDRDGFSLLAKLGVFETVDQIAVETWGRANPVPELSGLCRQHGWRLMDIETWEPLGF